MLVLIQLVSVRVGTKPAIEQVKDLTPRENVVVRLLPLNLPIIDHGSKLALQKGSQGSTQLAIKREVWLGLLQCLEVRLRVCNPSNPFVHLLRVLPAGCCNHVALQCGFESCHVGHRRPLRHGDAG